MSNLQDHARAARHLSAAFDRQARRHSFDKAVPVLTALSAAYLDAAQAMEREIQRDAEAMAKAHACTIDHRAITVPKCPACGAPREGK